MTTNTQPPAPTDAEIAALIPKETSWEFDVGAEEAIRFARAVLAKWGAQPVPASAAEFALQALVAAGHVSQELVDRAITLPGAPQAPAHSVEPVAVALGFVRDDGVFRHAPKFQRPGDTWTPVYTAPQPVVREPLTDEQIDEWVDRFDYTRDGATRLARAIERAHGITGAKT